MGFIGFSRFLTRFFSGLFLGFFTVSLKIPWFARGFKVLQWLLSPRMQLAQSVVFVGGFFVVSTWF